MILITNIGIWISGELFFHPDNREPVVVIYCGKKEAKKQNVNQNLELPFLIKTNKKKSPIPPSLKVGM